MSNGMPRAAYVFTGLLALAVCLPKFAVADEPSTAELPVTRVVLFNSGVGFFEHNGKVDGTQQVVLKFGTDEINDLLKSIVLQDLGGGQVSAVTYDAREPLLRTLKTFTIDLTRAPTLADLLQQVRGQRIQVETPQPIDGVILGIETRRVADGDAVVDKQFLNLKTDGGLRSVAMDSIVQSKLLDKKLNAELDEALALLATARSMDKKNVTLQFRGEGNRDVRVGYIQETPVWKASYRLVLNGDKPPFLQGWAIVENTGEQDWKEVKLSLVSGRPISFIMDLYEPLFVERPTVVPEEFAGLKPRVHGQDLGGYVPLVDTITNTTAHDKKVPARGGGGAFGFGGGFGGGGVGGGRTKSEEPTEKAAAPLDPSQGVATAADAGDIGELFRYEIKTPVTLARHKSAMLPIVNAPVEGKKISIYNQAVQAKHPYNGFRLTNSTDLHLLQGPITVFDGGEFAGDAQIEDVPPGGKRLVSYAIDLDVEVAPELQARPDELASMSIAKGALKLTHQRTRRQQYTVKNSSDQKKTVLIEQPIDTAWQLVSPKEPAEKTRDLYRFEVAVEPGKSAKLEVEQQQKVAEQVVLSTLDSPAVLAFATTAAKLNPAAAKALQKAAELKNTRDAAIAEVARVQSQIKSIETEQSRIRQNLPQLDRAGTLYGRYVKKLAEQEDEIEGLRKQYEALNEKSIKARQAIDAYLTELNIE
jgi:hypothetical protein